MVGMGDNWWRKVGKGVEKVAGVRSGKGEKERDRGRKGEKGGEWVRETKNEKV